MTCALCKLREANKKNTHYLTDGIIRKCLNLHGSSQREKGFYFDMSNSNPFVEFNFQRIDEVSLKDALGRNPTDEEIENARQIPFSVDYVFCDTCEKIFTSIESEFIEKILPKFRNSNLLEKSQLTLKETSLIRLFFYIQIWRSSICEEIFQLSEEVKENLRLIILTKETENINHFPLIITYLETTGGDEVYTENYVGFTNDKNPNIIFMNDFIIQFFENENSISFNDFYGLNRQETFKSFVNINEQDDFIIPIIPNDGRKLFLNTMIKSVKVKHTLEFLTDSFSVLWRRLFYGLPPRQYLDSYLKGLTKGNNENILQYSNENITTYTYNFFIDILKNKIS